MSACSTGIDRLCEYYDIDLQFWIDKTAFSLVYYYPTRTARRGYVICRGVHNVPTKILKCSQNAYFSGLTMPLLHEMIPPSIADVASLLSLPDLLADRPAIAPFLQPTCNSYYTKRNRLRPLSLAILELRLLNYYFYCM